MGKKRSKSRSRSRGAAKEKRGKSRSRSASRSRGRSAERRDKDKDKEKDKAAATKKRDRSASSSSGKSSEDEEEMKEFLLSTDMPEDQMLVKMMGFSAFDSTKGKDHSGADLSDVKRATKRQYRQYMNRRGGFNRPLDALVLIPISASPKSTGSRLLVETC